MSFQVGKNLASGHSIKEALTHDINVKSIMISGVAGALTSGLSATGGKGTPLVITTSIDVADSMGKQAMGGDGSVTIEQTVSDVVSDEVAGFLTKRAENVVETKILRQEADRTARVSAKDPSSSGRSARARVAESKLDKAQRKNFISGTSAPAAVNSIQTTANAMRDDMKGNVNPRNPNSRVGSDATRVERKAFL